MRINPQAKTAASYAKLFKEKIEQSRENTTRSNGISENSKQEKPTVKGIKFDELSDWDNIVYDKKNDNNNVNNNNDNNNNPLSDFSVNTSTFTYRVNEMGGCDKIDLSTMNSNEGNIVMNQKMKMFNANTNMISQIKQSKRNDIPEDINSNVIKEEEDEYKNYSKNTFNEKDYKGYYLENQKWKKCHDNCATCSNGGVVGNNNCDTCATGRYFEKKGSKNCLLEREKPSGYYINVDI